MKVIYKAVVPIADQFSLMLPKDTDFLRFDNQANICCLWYLVDPQDKSSEEYRFHIVGTGHPTVDGDWVYIGTTICHRGEFVWHLFVE